MDLVLSTVYSTSIVASIPGWAYRETLSFLAEPILPLVYLSGRAK